MKLRNEELARAGKARTMCYEYMTKVLKLKYEDGSLGSIPTFGPMFERLGGTNACKAGAHFVTVIHDVDADFINKNRSLFGRKEDYFLLLQGTKCIGELSGFGSIHLGGFVDKPDAIRKIHKRYTLHTGKSFCAWTTVFNDRLEQHIVTLLQLELDKFKLLKYGAQWK